MIPTDKPSDKRVRALNEAVKSVIAEEQVACANCKHVHWDHLTGLYACWKAPPTAVGAWVQTRDGSMNLQVGGMRPPVQAAEYCAEFVRKVSA
jgi:hypothetical protein